MRIKRLDITGFKSFMDRTVFSFGEGITAVVGPNGCGKSNVVDAIRWVMGEQSAKNLRGRGMEDVIFNGSESHAPLSLAEVSLTFTVEEQDVLPQPWAGFPEVTVTRRLFRSGESEYLINKQICRLLDVTELFLGTGVGTRAYSIIEQGRVGLIVSSKPEDRRSLIEEAAGITRYKARRRSAERKMESTRANLLRVNDIVGELDKRLESVQRQAKRAEKARKLRAEMRDIELHAASHRYLELAAQQQLLRAQLAGMGEEEQGAIAGVREMEQDIETRRAALELETAALQKLQDEVHALESQVSLESQSLGHWEADAAEATRRAQEARNELAGLEERLQELERNVAARESELSGLDDGWRGDEERLKAAREELAQGNRRHSELGLLLEHERAALVQLAGRLANHESNLNNLGRRREELEARVARLAQEKGALEQDLATLEQARLDVAQRVDAGRQVSVDLAERKREEEEALARTRQAFAENEIHVISLREELSDKRSRLTSLEELQRHYEGFDRGVRAVMLRAGGDARSQGIFGLVADVLTVNPRFERAVEAALGERLQHVLVDSRRVGLELLDFLREGAEGRSTFLPVDGGDQPVLTTPDLSRDGVLAHALAEVQVEPALQPVLERLLGDVVVVTDAAAAEAYLREVGPGATLVTLAGEVFRADGSMTGGALEGPAVGALHKKRELAELAVAVAPDRGALQRDPHPALRPAEADRAGRGRAQGTLQEPARRGAAAGRPRRRIFHRAGEESGARARASRVGGAGARRADGDPGRAGLRGGRQPRRGRPGPGRACAARGEAADAHRRAGGAVLRPGAAAPGDDVPADPGGLGERAWRLGAQGAGGAARAA